MEDVASTLSKLQDASITDSERAMCYNQLKRLFGKQDARQRIIKEVAKSPTELVFN